MSGQNQGKMARWLFPNPESVNFHHLNNTPKYCPLSSVVERATRKLYGEVGCSNQPAGTSFLLGSVNLLTEYAFAGLNHANGSNRFSLCQERSWQGQMLWNQFRQTCGRPQSNIMGMKE